MTYLGDVCDGDTPPFAVTDDVDVVVFGGVLALPVVIPPPVAVVVIGGTLSASAL
jgi:hypothetical protein